MITFRYRDSSDDECTGVIRILSDNDPLEIEVDTNGWTFHVLVGEYSYGRYICIPNWNVGSEFSRLDDEFWNDERLCNYTNLHQDNVKAVVRAVAVVDDWINKYHEEECG